MSSIEYRFIEVSVEFWVSLGLNLFFWSQSGGKACRLSEFINHEYYMHRIWKLYLSRYFVENLTYVEVCMLLRFCANSLPYMVHDTESSACLSLVFDFLWIFLRAACSRFRLNICTYHSTACNFASFNSVDLKCVVSCENGLY